MHILAFTTLHTSWINPLGVVPRGRIVRAKGIGHWKALLRHVANLPFRNSSVSSELEQDLCPADYQGQASSLSHQQNPDVCFLLCGLKPA